MATYEMGIFITQDAYDYAENKYGFGWRPQYRAREFYQGAFDESSHNVSWLYTNHIPNPPQEKIFDDFTTSCFCYPRYNCTYDNLWEWWKNYCKVDCTDFATADDTNVLISMADGGGLGGGRFAVTSQADHICELPSSYERYGYGDEYHAMWVAMQEAGHSLINSWDSDDDGDVAHDLGEVFYHDWTRDTITPMGINGSTNDCRESYDKSNTSQSHLHWSTCAELRFK